MKWLNEYAAVPISAEEYTRKMIMSGTAVEGVETTGEQFDGVVVGKITSIRKHEDSDHLLVCQVDVGRETVQIVTGAPNVSEGQYVPVALDGARLPGGIIKSGMLRGVKSEGMLCSGAELDIPEGLYPHCGEAGILIFQEEYPLGIDVKQVFGLGDQVVDFEILANRPDCLSVWGIARETAAALETHFVMPIIEVEDGEGRFEDFASVQVTDDHLCPRYCARVVKNVRIGPSPMWMREYLYGAGVRPINNIVDITNFVMLETGHPMHAFDLDKVRDRSIIVRRARPGEELTTLDGKHHHLTPDMLVIADKHNATGLAGIMGGEDSEITGETRELLFECAAFDRTNTRLTARALGIRTESSGRFERGVCPATVREALERACMLVNMLDCGDIVPGVYDHYPNPAPERVIDVNVRRIAERVAVDIPGEAMQDILERLFFDVTLDGDTLRVAVPPYRVDIETEADISEEVLRLYGYDAIPSTLMRGETMPGGRSSRQKLFDVARTSMAARGYFEITTYSFVSPKWLNSIALPAGDARLDPLTILNPLGEDTGVMRTSLLPSMLDTVALNINRGNAAGKLFELAPEFMKRAEELPDERWVLQLGVYGPDVDFYSIKEDVCSLLAAYGIEAEARAGGDPYYHPGRKAELYADGVLLGDLGEVHPDVAGNFGIERRVYAARLHMRAIEAAQKPLGAVVPLPKYPPNTRDLALQMREEVEVGPLMALMKQKGGDILEEIHLFDIYRGAQLGEGMKSAAFALTFRSPDRTLAEAEVAEQTELILTACAAEYGAVLRK